jgi:hypothetical protein
MKLKLSGSQWAVIGLLVLVAGWLLVLTQGLAWMYGRKVRALVGQELAVVEKELGPPTRDWGLTRFSCAERYPCQGQARGGRVFLYADGRRGYYLYFDEKKVLAEVEAVLRRK